MARRPVETEIETYPEADGLQGYPHPRHAGTLYGHAGQRRTLAAAIDTGRLHHAWIVSGPEGIGKASFAYKAAKYALAASSERADDLEVATGCVADRQVRQLSHPGLLVIRRSYDIKAKRFPASITVDDVRRLRGFLSHRAGENQWRVIIVDRADEMNLNAANALLKSLEEPPARTVFFLVALEPGRLLPTIRSRCRLLPLASLDERDLLAAAKQAFAASPAAEEQDEPDWQALTAAADGSVRRILQLAGAGGRELTGAVDQLLRAGRTPEWSQLHDLAERLAPAAMQADYELFLNLLQERLAGLIKAGAGAGDTPAGGERPLQLAPHGGLATWIDLWETIQRERMQVQALNLDRSAFLLDVFARIRRAVSTTS